MKAARWYGNKDVRIENIPKPKITKDDDVLLEIEWCGVCGTDLHEYEEGPVYIQEHPHVLTGQKTSDYPRTRILWNCTGGWLGCHSCKDWRFSLLLSGIVM